MKASRARGDESGFTLVELLVTCVVQSMIVAAIASSFFLFAKAQDSTKKRLQKTTDAQLAATYFITDAQAVSGPEVSLTDTTSCADPSPPVTGTLTAVARLTWSVTAGAGTTTTDTINYVRTGSSLMRRYCRGASLIDDIVVGRNIATATVTCSPTTNCTGTPTTITITATETQDSSETSAYSYTLSAAFRKVPALGSAPTSPPAGPFPLLALNGTGSGLNITGNGTLKINNSGTIIINSTTNDAALNVGGTIMGAAAVQGLGTCTNLFCPSNYSQIAQAPADPYKGLAAPSTAGLPARSGCAGGNALPGVYAATLNLTGTGISCAFASGVYVFQAGLSITGSVSLTSAAGGVFFYIAGGSLSLTGSGSISLTPMTTGTYANILVYQSRTNASTMTLTGSGTVNGYNGLVYAPAGQVSLVGSGSLAVKSLITASLAMTVSGGTATVG